MGDLSGCVNTCVGPAGSGYAGGVWFQSTDGLLDQLLDRGLVGLTLPTGKRCAVIFDFESKAGHC